MAELQPWHRLFGLWWIDLLSKTDLGDELEVDLSRKLPLLHVVIVRTGGATVPPDGRCPLAQSDGT